MRANSRGSNRCTLSYMGLERPKHFEVFYSQVLPLQPHNYPLPLSAAPTLDPQPPQHALSHCLHLDPECPEPQDVNWHKTEERELFIAKRRGKILLAKPNIEDLVAIYKEKGAGDPVPVTVVYYHRVFSHAVQCIFVILNILLFSLLFAICNCILCVRLVPAGFQLSPGAPGACGSHCGAHCSAKECPGATAQSKAHGRRIQAVGEVRRAIDAGKNWARI